MVLNMYGGLCHSDSREAVCGHPESQRVAFFTLETQVRTPTFGRETHPSWLRCKETGLSAFPPLHTKGISTGICVNFRCGEN